jgi:hypothetical protein
MSYFEQATLQEKFCLFNNKVLVKVILSTDKVKTFWKIVATETGKKKRQ